MPVSELHKIKKKKNFTVLAIIAFICVLIWAVTLIKIDRANAADIMSCGQPSTCASVRYIYAPFAFP